MTVVKSDASDTVQVTASTAKTIVLADFPPAVWSTVGFLLLLAVIIAVIMAVVAFLLFRRRKK